MSNVNDHAVMHTKNSSILRGANIIPILTIYTNQLFDIIRKNICDKQTDYAANNTYRMNIAYKYSI
jgi:hypothetical protein